jgi:NDP-sugar pyrophosphorylase family protein
MKAVIIAEHSRIDLRPLTDRIPHPLLPVAGKPILMHALELLHRGSFREVDVLSPDASRKLEAAMDTGPLLGMKVRFVPDLEGIGDLQTHCLLVGLTHLLDASWDEELEQFGDLKVHALMPIRMTVCARPVGLLLPPRSGSKIAPDWADIHQTEAIQMSIGPKQVLETDSFLNYQQANFSLLRGEYRYLTPAGREFISGHRAAPKARIRAHTSGSEYGYFGTRCRVDRTAALDGHVVIGDEAVIAKGARISDSIILDRTYIGANTDFSGAIVDRDLLIKVETGAAMEIRDPVLFGATA